MIGLLQRVTAASVEIDNEVIAKIEKGLLVFIGVEKNDTESQARRLIERILGYRVFSDQDGKMNFSLTDIEGELLLVPQFTLSADTKKGMRPSFSSAAPPAEGEKLFRYLFSHTKEKYPNVVSGRFGEDMQVSLTNDGPVTFWLRVPPK